MDAVDLSAGLYVGELGAAADYASCTRRFRTCKSLNLSTTSDQILDGDCIGVRLGSFDSGFACHCVMER